MASGRIPAGAETSDDTSSNSSGWEYYDDDVALSDFWQAMVDRQTENPAPLWLQMESESHPGIEKFLEFWRVMVPRLLSPTCGKTSLDQTYDANRIKAALLDPLESFIAGGVGCEEEVIKVLAQNDTPPALCGYVFKFGEAVYSCRDCGQDTTCVLCSECFKHSEHKNHRYRMSTTEGGGYCDCGDHEAFLQHALCSKHSAMNVDQISSGEVLKTFPEEIKNRTRKLFHEIIQYCFIVTSAKKKYEELLVGNKEKELWPELKYCFEFSNYCLMILNDNSHSYPDVTNFIRNSFGSAHCSERQAQDLTELADKDGRCMLKVSTYKDCATLRDKIDRLSRRQSLPIGTSILPAYVVAHQNFAIRLIEWLPKLFHKCSGFRALFAEVALSMEEQDLIILPNSDKEEKINAAKAILITDHRAWKELRKAWINVVIEGILKEYDSKLKFARLFARNYKFIMDEFIRDEQESDVTIVNLTVQMFTVKSIAHILIEEENLFYEVVNFLKTLLSSHNDDQYFKLESWMEDEKDLYLKSQSAITDLMFLLRVPIEEGRYNDTVRASFSRGVDKFVQLLGLLQLSDPFKRQTGNHVEFESREWEYVGSMIASLAGVSGQIQKWCSRDKAILINTTSAILKAITNHNSDFHLEMSEKVCQVGSITTKYMVPEVNIYTEKISVNVPFQRFLASILPAYSSHAGEFARKLKQRIESHGDPVLIANFALTSVAVLCSITAGLWKRNGTPVRGRAFLYHNFYTFPSLKRNDLILLQATACLLEDPGRLVMTLLQRFRLISWANCKLESKPALLAGDFIESTVKMGQEFLGLITALVMERHIHNVGKVSDREELRHRMIQILCSEGMTHSVVVKKLEIGQDDVPFGDEVLKEVAELKPSPTERGKKVYEVRPEFLSHYNPFYYYYSQEQHSKAWDKQIEIKRKNKERPVCPPPEQPPLTPVFSRLTKILSSPPMMQVIETTLKRASTKSKLLSPKMVIQVCYLIMQGYQDDIMTNESDFAKFAEELDFVGLLQKALEPANEELKTKELSEYIQYTLDRANEARELILNIARSDDRESPSTKGDQDEAQARKRRAAAAANRRHKLMAQMSQMQDKFAKENAAVLEKMEVDVDLGAASGRVLKLEDHVDPIAIGPGRTSIAVSEPKYTCILCQEDSTSLEVDGENNAFVMAAYIQRCMVLSQSQNWADRNRGKCSEEYLPSSLDCGPLVTSCGHPMHSLCFQNYFDSLVQKERERQHNAMFQLIINYNVNKSEYLCPICERLSVGFLPLVPSLSKLIPLIPPSETPFKEWVMQMSLKASQKEVETLKADFIPKSVIPKLVFTNKRALKSATSPPKLPKDLISQMGVYSANLGNRALDLAPTEEDFRLYQLSYEASAFALHMTQAAKEHLKMTESLSSRDQDALRSLIRTSLVLPISKEKTGATNGHHFRYLRANALYLLSVVLLNDQKLHMLEVDPLNCLIALTAALPNFGDELYSFGKQDHHILKLCFMMELLQILHGFHPIPIVRNEDGEEQTPSLPPSWIEEEQTMTRLFRDLAAHTGHSDRGIPHNLASQIKKKLMHFMRCASLFYHYYTDVPLPRKESYVDLCLYLGLPNSLKSVVEDPGCQEILERFLRSPNLSHYPKHDRPPKVRKFIDLPTDYTTLIDKAASFKCPNSASGESKKPLLCLVCGEMICSRSRCCEVKIGSKTLGACNAHLRKCGSDAGIFLNIRKSEVMILTSGNRGAMLQSPYVDEYGESDEGFRRGNPLHLDEDMYLDLQRSWITAEIPDRISREFDSETLIIQENWHSL